MLTATEPDEKSKLFITASGIAWCGRWCVGAVAGFVPGDLDRSQG